MRTTGPAGFAVMRICARRDVRSNLFHREFAEILWEEQFLPKGGRAGTFSPPARFRGPKAISFKVTRFENILLCSPSGLPGEA
jgi:hypothetical protein